MIIPIELGDNSYDIVLERGSLGKIDEYIDLNRKVLIVTDEGVPIKYAETIANRSKESYIAAIKGGEKSKSLKSFEELLTKMLRAGFSRKDCVVAIGGGVVGDLAGFTASAYMRGVDFYNVPTTLLSQVDSSIGGKTAVNLDGIKNIVGAFYQPKKVIIDPETLSSLSKRQIANGLAESIKMSLIEDEDLFNIFENEDIYSKLDLIIERSLLIKKNVVEKDEKEQGLRKILNFGHTIGHGYESTSNGELYHGEAVALGMLPLCSDDVRERLIRVLKRVGLPIEHSFDKEKVYEAVTHDKKAAKGSVSLVKVNKAGSFIIEETKLSKLRDLIK